VAQAVEKLFSVQPAKVVLFAEFLEHGVEPIGDIGGVREEATLFADVDGPVLARPLVQVLKQMLVKGAVAVGGKREIHARGFIAARTGYQPLASIQFFAVCDP